MLGTSQGCVPPSKRLHAGQPQLTQGWISCTPLLFSLSVEPVNLTLQSDFICDPYSFAYKLPLLLALGLEDLELHHIVVNTWEHGVDSEQNVVLISIASVVDPSLAPKGKHTLHAYLPATEPFEIWQDMKQGTPEYEQLKKERSQVLWKAVERVIPDIRKRTEIEMVCRMLSAYTVNVGLSFVQMLVCSLCLCPEWSQNSVWHSIVFAIFFWNFSMQCGTVLPTLPMMLGWHMSV